MQRKHAIYVLILVFLTAHLKDCNETVSIVLEIIRVCQNKSNSENFIWFNVLITTYQVIFSWTQQCPLFYILSLYISYQIDEHFIKSVMKDDKSERLSLQHLSIQVGMIRMNKTKTDFQNMKNMLPNNVLSLEVSTISYRAHVAMRLWIMYSD